MVRRDGGAHGVWHTSQSLHFCRCGACVKQQREAMLDPTNAGKTKMQLVHEKQFGYLRGNSDKDQRVTMRQRGYLPAQPDTFETVQDPGFQAAPRPLEFSDFLPAARHRAPRCPRAMQWVAVGRPPAAAAPAAVPKPCALVPAAWPVPCSSAKAGSVGREVLQLALGMAHSPPPDLDGASASAGRGPGPGPFSWVLLRSEAAGGAGSLGGAEEGGDARDGWMVL
mmetsp:Transcript_173877/g.557308  ORF Transcript_173877/g.557308 Transcript_173877/m.557308 type:complete len:224 (-) Transcript_173877:194-865(-)